VNFNGIPETYASGYFANWMYKLPPKKVEKTKKEREEEMEIIKRVSAIDTLIFMPRKVDLEA
jgi:hypothetical protein